ncbi:lactate utilization protein C [Streptomyces sp. NBC_00887]|uniref:LutC/YkgG family protein n=1 Tax=Streptomyces sp. NBC_00887 TaxID=2975859 RepID=UPI00386856B6|nr:LUD domain-containing protein [Streptomyces sp. NBC_00887]WSY36340.1 LUD domain-containing protein [Streptomyces sp. NBC_00887]
MSSREAILGRVHAALTDVPLGERPDDVPVPRDYRKTHTEPDEDTVALLAERVADYRAAVSRTDRAGLRDAIATALSLRGATRLAPPDGFPGELLPPGDWEWHPEPMDVPALDTMDGAITLASAGIPVTGTIVSDADADQNRRALTLIPDYHLCIIRAEQIADDVPGALARLDPRMPLTFLSGPSATSDIELDRVEGVHGPRTLDVIVVDPTSSEQP